MKNGAAHVAYRNRNNAAACVFSRAWQSFEELVLDTPLGSGVYMVLWRIWERARRRRRRNPSSFQLVGDEFLMAGADLGQCELWFSYTSSKLVMVARFKSLDCWANWS